MELINMTIGECLEHRASKSREKVFLKHGKETYTWQNVSQITNELALIFKKRGMQKGDRIGILGVNSPSWIFCYFAVVKLGAAAVLVNACCKEREVRECIKASKMNFMLYTSGHKGLSYEEMVKNLKTHRDSQNVEYIYTEKTNQEWKQLTLPENYSEAEMPRVDCHELASVLFTSGTTGHIKGVKLSHHSMVNNAKAIVEKLRWENDDCMCLAVPLFHCFGVTVSLISSLIAGCSVVVLEKYNTLDVCRAVQNEKCTIFNGVPSMFLAMLNNEKIKDYRLDSLRSGIIAGSPIYEDDYKDICGMLKNIRLQTAYGLTETSPCVSISDYDAPIELKAANAGRVMEHVQVKIIDDRTGESCAVNEQGEICVKGYNLTIGYLNCSGEECEAIEDDGWLKTGDIGYFDEDGYLHIVCRKKNIIITGGENISPDEITRFIRDASGRKEVFVFGIKSGVLQEEIASCIEAKENAEELNKIKKYLDENLSRYKIPKHFVFLEKMPRNSTGKLDEKKIKALVLEKLNVR